ncbi:MAG TPA: hypothetical protein VFO60_09070, partial [Candidatus Dormibacteraeota bacterium]|nr:hypothetical protein [Candidatus Dormibacteraeota bacterium]
VWTQDWTHAEESRGAVLMLCALTFAIHALRTGHTGAAILAGVSGQALMAVYFPIFGVLGVAAGGAALGAVVEALRAGATRRWARGLALIAVSGALAGAVNLRWLLVDGGFGNWVAQAVQVIPESSAYAITFPWTTDLGIAPIATLYRFEPILLWGDAWDAAAQTGALGLAAVVAAGLYALSRRRRLVEVGALTAGLGYAVVQRYDSASAYPAAKVFSYVLPLTAIAVAAGLAWIGSLSAIGPRRIRLPAGRLIAGTLLSALLLVQVVSTVETHAMFARLPDQLPADSLAMATLPDLVPAGAPTLLYDPAQPPQGGATVNTFVLFQAAYFLVGRDTIGPSDPFVPPQATGALPDAAHPLTPEQAGGYAFIVVPVGSPSPVPGFADFRLDWTGAGLQLYARSAAASQG